jgi:hypothetical protein
MSSPPDAWQLRQLVLAASVLYDIDIEPLDAGILIPGPYPVVLTWAEIRTTATGSKAVAAWLRAATWCARYGRDELATRIRPVGLPVGHCEHLGADWVADRVPGGLIDLGPGFVGIGDDPDEVKLIPPPVLAAAAIDPRPWWPTAMRYLEVKGGVAGRRLRTDPGGILRPIGDCDVVTLLGSHTFRTLLCATDSARMRAAVVPMRRRGWIEVRRVDPAFAVTAAAVTDAAERGFDRPILVTASEVALAPLGGSPVIESLRDPAGNDRGHRSFRYR